MKEFIKQLKEHGYRYKIENDKIVITHDANINSDNLTTLPKNVTFANSGYVCLRNLKTLPENTVFSNKYNVYLDTLETISKNTAFNNRSNIYLNALKILPKKVKFSNEGNIYLSSVETLSEDIVFNNKDSVYLDSLRTKQLYQNKLVEFKPIDGYQMLLTVSKKFKDYTLHKARYLCGGKIKDMLACFIAEKRGMYAHGETAK